MDDTFVIWSHSRDKLEAFHQHLSEQHLQIEFTMEMEKDRRITFQDVAVTRRDGAFTTEMYRKPIHTDLYTHYTSHHHPSVKAGTVINLGRRVETLCDGESKNKKFEHLRDSFDES